MYKAAVNFLRGQVLVHIESGCPERVVNLCAGGRTWWRTARPTWWPGGRGL